MQEYGAGVWSLTLEEITFIDMEKKKKSVFALNALTLSAPLSRNVDALAQCRCITFINTGGKKSVFALNALTLSAPLLKNVDALAQ